MSKKIEKNFKKFKDGFINTVKKEDTLFLAAIAGLWQGLKYNGSLTNGAKGAVSVILTLGCYGGVKEIIRSNNE